MSNKTDESPIRRILLNQIIIMDALLKMIDEVHENEMLSLSRAQKATLRVLSNVDI